MTSYTNSERLVALIIVFSIYTVMQEFYLKTYVGPFLEPKEGPNKASLEVNIEAEIITNTILRYIEGI